MFAAEVGDSFPCRKNYAGPIPDRLYAKGTSKEPEIVPQSPKKVDDVDHFRSYDSLLDHIRSTAYQKSFDALDNLELNLEEFHKWKSGRRRSKRQSVDKAVRSYTREGWGFRVIDMERPAATFDTVVMESEVKKGIIDDLDKFVVNKEPAGHSGVRGKGWKRGYLLYEPPGGTGSESSLITAMANYLSYDIYYLNVTSFSLLLKLRTLVTCIGKRSIIAIKGFDCMVGMEDGGFTSGKWEISDLLSLIDFALSGRRNERIIVCTTNHKDQLDPALLYPFDKDFYIHKSLLLPRPRGLTGGENLQLDPTDQQSLVDFDARNNIAHLVRADRSVPIGCYSEKISTRETLKREFIDNSGLSLEDTLQYFGGRPDDAPKSLGGSFRQELHMPDSLEGMPFEELETLPLQEQPNDTVLKSEFVVKDSADKTVKLFTREGIARRSIKEKRPGATFDAMESKAKNGVIDDLDKLVVSKEEAAGHTNAWERDYFVEAKSKQIKDSVDKAVKIYTKEGMAWRSIDMERPAATFDTVAMESEVKKGVIDDLDKFVVSKEEEAGDRKVRGKSWKRGYFLYEPPGGTGSESSLIAAMANYLSYDIYDLNVRSFSSLLELRTLMASTTNRSIIAVKDFDCCVDTPDKPLDSYELTLAEFLCFIGCLWSISGNEHIIVFTTSRKSRLYPGILRPLKNIYIHDNIYIHTSSPSPQPRGFIEGGENLQLDSMDQQSLVDYDAVNNRSHLIRADRSVPIVCYSEKVSIGEALKREFIDNRELSLEDMERPVVTFDTVAMESEVKEALIDDLDKFVVRKEAAVGHRRVRSKAWKRGYLLYDPGGGTGSESSLIAAMGNYLGYDICYFNLTGLSSRELEESLVSTPNCSIIAIKDCDCSVDMQDGPLNPNKMGISELLTFIDSALSSNGNDHIIVFTINHKDGLDPALLVPFMEDFYIHKSSPSPQPRGSTGGQNLQLDSTDQQSLVDFDAINNRGQLVGAVQSVPIVCYPEKISTGEALKREFIDNSVLGLEDTKQYSGGRPDDAPKSHGDTFGHGLHTPDSPEQLSFKKLQTLPPQEQPNDIILAKNTSGQELHTPDSLEWMSFKVVETLPLQEQTNDIIPLKREFTTKGILSLEDHQQHLGSRCEDDVKNLVVSISNMKGILRQHEIHQRPFQQNWATMKERPKGVLSLSMDEKLDPRLQSAYASKLASSTPRPLALAYGGEIVGPISSSSSEVAAMNIKTQLVSQDQSASTASHSEKKITRATSKREGITSRVFSSEDGQQHFGSRHKDSAKGLGVQQSLVDFDAKNNRARLVKADQSSPTVSNSEKENTQEALKREQVNESVLSLEDPQHFGGRSKDAVKGLGGFPTADSLVPKSFILRETLRLQEQPNGIRDLVSRRRLKIGGCVRLEKLPDLPRIQQMNCSGRLTPQSASFSRWTIGLPRGEHIVELDPLEQFAENAAYVAREGQSYTVYLSEKKVERKTLKRKFRIMCVLSLQDGQQHTCGKCEDAANSLDVKRICREHGINQVSIVKRIGRQNGINRCLFEQSARTSHWPIGLPDGGPILQLKLLEPSTNNVAHGAKADQSCPIVSLSNKKILRKTLNREFRPMTSHSLENQQQQFDSGLKDSPKSLGVKLICREHGINQVSAMKRICRQHRIHRHRWPFQRPASFSNWTICLPRGEHIVELDPLERSAENAAYGAREDQSCTVYFSEKKIVRKTLKRKFRILCVLSLRNCRQQTCGKCEDAANSVGVKRIWREHGINQVSTVKRICKQNGIHRCLFEQSARTSHWPIGLPDGGPILQLELLEPSTNNVAHGARADQSCPTVSLSNKKILRKTLNGEFRPMTVRTLKNHQQHFGSRCEDSAKNIGVKCICREHGSNHVSTVKRIRKQHRILHHRWPFRRKWASMKGYSLGEERPVEVISLSMHGKLVSWLQCIYRSRLGRSSHRPLAIRSGGKIVRHIALSSSDFDGTSNRPHLVRQDRSGSNAPHPDKKKTRETTNKDGTASSLFSKEYLEQHFGMTRKDAAEKLGVSVSTLKRMCRDHGIQRWQNRRRNNVWRPPDPHGERNTSSTCETLAINGQTQMENGIGGQNLEPNDFPPDYFEDPNLLNKENGSIAGLVNIPPFPDSGPVYSPDVDFFSLQVFGKESEGAGLLFHLPCQLNDPSAPSTSYANPNAPVFPQNQVASTQMLCENMGSLEGCRSLLDSQEQPFLAGHVSGYNSCTMPTCFGPVPDQPMASVPCALPPPIELQDMRFVKVKARYGDTKIKFKLPLTSGIIELKKEVEMRLELDSCDIEYEDEDEEGDWIRITCDKDLGDYLRPFSLLANPIVKLRVLDKVAYGTEVCGSCGSLKRKRPY